MSPMSIAQSQRNTVSVSISHLAERLQNLEAKADPYHLRLTRDIERKLNSLDADFRKHHFAIIDLIEEENEEMLSREQEILDSHDDKLDSLFVRIKLLLSAISHSLYTERQRKSCLLKLSCLQKKILSIRDAVVSSTTESCLHQHAKTIRVYNDELRKVAYETCTLDLSDSDDIHSLQAQLEQEVFDCCLKIRRLLASTHTSLTPTSLLESDDNRTIVPQIESKSQSDPDLSLSITAPLVLENSDSYDHRTQTLTPDSQILHDYIDACEKPLVTGKEEEPSHSLCETLQPNIDSIACHSNVVDSVVVTLSSRNLCLPIIACCDADFSDINDIDPSPNHPFRTCISSVVMSSTCELHSRQLTKLLYLSHVTNNLCKWTSLPIESYLRQSFHVCHGQRHSMQYILTNSRLCVEIIRSLTPSHVT